MILENIEEIFEQDKYLTKIQKSNLKIKLTLQLAIAFSFFFLSIANVIVKSYSMLIFTTIGFAANMTFAFISLKLNSEKLSAYSSLITCSVLFAVFVINGGNDGFACLWIVLLPVVSMIVMDFKAGLYVSIFLQIFLIVVFWTPINEKLLYEYNAQFCMRFPLLFFVSFMLSFFLTASLRQAEYKERRHELELDRAREKQKTLLDRIPVGIMEFCFEEDGIHIVSANKSITKMMGFDKQKALGEASKKITLLTHPDDIPIILDTVEKLRIPGSYVEYEYRNFFRTRSEYVWLLGQGRSSVGPDGCVYAYINYTDITDRKENEILQRKLKGAEIAAASKAEFYSRMSHDMRTPMNGILGLTALSRDETDVTVLKENLAKIDESGKYLLGIINDTLDMQRIESGKLTLNPEVVNCRKMIGSAIEMVRPSIVAKKIDFQIVNKGIIMDCDVRIDPVRMKQIFVNLISNAIKFTPEGGEIIFEFECLGREAGIVHDRFTVRDNGVGMSESFLQDKIFQSYAQEQNTFSNQYAGTGLGLSIVKKLVDLMGGTIEVKSKLGEGTVFIICLDIERIERKPENKPVLEESENKKNEMKCLSGCNILLAEDHPLNAEIAEKLLEKVGCTVTWVKDGQECLDTMKQFKPGQFDAILMDLRMPVMDGLTAAREIRKLDDEASKSIPMIAMTANAYAEDVQHCLEAGMNAHVAKPVNPNILYDTLAAHINKK